MAHFFPYEINHIKLDQSISLILKDSQKNGQYNIFWWKKIPLGQLFIEVGDMPISPEYDKKIWQAIAPALSSYTKEQEIDIDIIKALFIAKDFPNFYETMESLFDNYELEPKEQVDISIVICTRNRAGYLANCLNTLQYLSPKPKEVIVIDNAPSDDSTHVVAKQFNDVVYVKETRTGLDIARNKGIACATASIVAFMDDDIKAEPNCLAEMAHTFENKEIAAMTGLVIAAELETEAQFLFEKEWSFNRGYSDKLYDKHFFDKTFSIGPPVWEIGAGANMAFRKSVLNRTGYFDERLDAGAAGCNGDSEIWFRILANGYTIAYNPRAVVHHEHRKNIAELQKQLYNYMKGFTVAALIQQKQEKKAGYYRQLFKVLPLWYLKLIIKGFPGYRSRYRTVFSEIRGMFAGFLYFIKHRKGSSII